jgi:hypothetical protein
MMFNMSYCRLLWGVTKPFAQVRLRVGPGAGRSAAASPDSHVDIQKASPFNLKTVIN